MTKSPSAVGHAPNRLPLLGQRLGTIEYRSPASLTAYENNPRTHSEKQLVKLMASIREFGFALPVLIDPEAVIIAGHARVEAARRLSLAEIPVLIADQWSKAQVKAYRLLDNRSAELATWNEQALAVELISIIELDETPIDILGWETAEIDVIIDTASAQSEEADPADELPELPKIAVSALGDLWALGDHRLLCGNSLEHANWHRLMNGRTARMVLSDVPFNVPINGHVSGLGKVKHDEFAMATGEMSKAEFTTFLAEAIQRMIDHLEDGSVVDLFIDWRHIGEMQTAIHACGLSVINICVWHKTSGAGMGSLYRSQHELVFIAKKGKAPHTNNVQLGKYGRFRSNIWSYPGATGFSKTRMADLADHPTVKNLNLCADAILDVTHPGEIVLDAFMGSGTTIAAAERTKRVGYGIEIEPVYVDVAIRRWEKMTGKTAVLAETGETFAEVANRRSAEQSNITAHEAAEAA
jgi:DNA modification methylase